MWTSRTWRTVLAVSALAFVLPMPAFAQATQASASAAAIRADIEQLKQEFNERLAALEQRLATINGATPAVAAAPVAEPTTTPTSVAASEGGASDAPSNGGGAAAAKMFNPDMAVIGNFLGAAGQSGPLSPPSLQMAESEMSLQAVVDPYARADFFVAFGETGVELEEGFVTFTTLPGGLLTKVGKMRTAFGKVNGLHSHVLPWADRPLVTTNLLGGAEGMSDAGVSVARLIPNPWLFLEATGQVYRGDSEGLFHASQRRDLSYLGHLRAYHDLSESTNLDLGASYTHGHNDSASVAAVRDALSAGASLGPGGIILVGVDDPSRFTTQLFGLDATVRWKPLQRSIYHSFVGRAEAIWSQREQPDARQDASGFFVSGDYQFGRRWYAGGRLDRSGRADAADLHDRGVSATLTYMPSEFSQVRGQLRRTTYVESFTANEFLFQFQFAIGAHGAHPF